MPCAAGELCQVLDSTLFKAPDGRECRRGSAIEAARVWATVEDQEYIVEALRLPYEHDILIVQVAGTGVPEGGGVSDDENADGDDDITGLIVLRATFVGIRSP